MSAHSTLDHPRTMSTTAHPRARRIDALSLSSLTAGQWSLLGSDDLADGDVVALYVVRGDVHVRMSDSVHNARARSFLVLDGRASRRLVVDEGSEVLVLRIPLASVGGHVAAFRAVAGRLLDTAAGFSTVVGHLLDGLAVPAPDAEGTHGARLAQHIVGLLALLCRDNVECDDQRSSTLIAAMEFIDDRLGDERLSPDVVAAAQNVSTRTLHRLFEAEGCTIAGWIRARRLETCRAELLDPELRELSVSAIGVRSGLSDAAHFSRLFKAAYGVSPRDYRGQHLAHSCNEACRALSA